MNIEERLKLSYYKEIAEINAEHGICLVQHVETGKIYVKKELRIYNKSIYEELRVANLPNLPRIYGLFDEGEDGMLTVIEEYITGDTLEEITASDTSMSAYEIITICIKVCDILGSLHSLEPPIIHRDVKPSNIMRTADGRIVLIDLNAAKHVDQSKTKDTHLLGTDGYAAPEQYGFGTSDVRTDIYAMGMLIKTLIDSPIVKDIDMPISKKLAAIIDKCTQMNPKDRYTSMAELKSKLLGLCKSNQQINSDKETSAGYNQYLPPGFRSGNPINMIIAATSYIFIFWISITLEVEDSSKISLTMERIYCLIVLILIVLFTCNYCNIQDRFAICRNRNIYLRILGILLCDAILVICTAIPMVAISMLIEAIM